MPVSIPTAIQGRATVGAASAEKRKRRLAWRAERRTADLALVEAVLRGDDDAFRLLVERYQKSIYWIAHDILLDSEEARDVAQETFIRVHAALARFDQQRDFLNWIYRIARNLSIDALRRRNRRALPLEDLSSLSLPAPSPASAGVDGDVRARVARVVWQGASHLGSRSTTN